MKHFVDKDSIVRQIWGRADVILFIFAGAAAEFAVNKAVDWLYFTGKLPADPLGRLFSTVVYAQRIIFSEMEEANKAIDQITAIHSYVEGTRGAQIPDWAYRDVLFMLIGYSVVAYEVLVRKLNDDEKAEVFNVFRLVGQRMKLKKIPETYGPWLTVYHEHLENDTICSKFTTDLYKQYRDNLGALRYKLLIQVQLMIVPQRIRHLLKLNQFKYLSPLLWLYKLTRFINLDKKIITLLLPAVYKNKVRELARN